MYIGRMFIKFSKGVRHTIKAPGLYRGPWPIHLLPGIEIDKLESSKYSMPAIVFRCQFLVWEGNVIIGVRKKCQKPLKAALEGEGA